MSPLLAMNGNGKLLFEDPGTMYLAPEGPPAVASAREQTTPSNNFSAADSSLWKFGTDDFTMNTWMRHVSGDWEWSHGGDRIGGGADPGWALAIGNTSFFFRNWGTNFFDYFRSGFPTTNVLDGNWHMITIRRDGSTYQRFSRQPADYRRCTRRRYSEQHRQG